MTDGDKIAAATLACEASRQAVELTGTTTRGRDITGSILTLYWHFLQQIARPEQQAKD